MTDHGKEAEGALRGPVESCGDGGRGGGGGMVGSMTGWRVQEGSWIRFGVPMKAYSHCNCALVVPGQ